jgi:hypothetical protein
MSEKPTPLMMAMGRWRVEVVKDGVLLQCTGINNPSYMMGSHPDETPSYDEMIRELSSYVADKPNLTTITRYFFATEQRMNLLIKQLPQIKLR